jgi:curved DNA-binding protein CbpA
MTRAEPTHYERLGVTPAASSSEIRAAYRRLARDTHPDVNGPGVDATMAAVNEAWRVLGDPERRAEYDALLAPEPRRARPPPPPPPTWARREPSTGTTRDTSAGAESRPSWWNEPVPDEPESDLPITDGRAVQAFALLVAIAATIAVVVVGLLFAYAIFWSK